MDKIVMTAKDVSEIHKWANANEVSIDINIPFNKVELILDEGYSLKCYNKGTYVNMFILIDNINKGYFRFDRNTLKVIKNKIIGKENLKEEHFKAWIAQYLYTMAYITEYKPVLEPKEVRKPIKKHRKSHKTESNITYLFNRHYITNPSTTHKKHKTCEYAFKVRGHYRHLKNGKKIWVREYTKGKGKVKGKEYRL